MQSFKKGVHPPQSKLSASQGTIAAPIPKQVIIPLQQHIGAPCKPLVQPGDTVKLYQKIGDSDAGLSVPVHATVSGKVLEIAAKPAPNTAEVLSIVIERSDEPEPELKKESVAKLSVKDILARIREAGVVGMGGAGFPTHIKLQPKQPVDTLIINGCECEPFITADHRLMLEFTEELVLGILLEMKVLKLKEAIIAVEANKQDAIEALNRAIASQPIRLVKLKTKYPQGAEKILIKAVTGRECAHTRLPSEVGVVVSNVATAKAVHDAVYFSKPLVERIVTVAGDVEHPQNILARIGTPVHELLSLCGEVELADKVLVGGPMMGITQYTDAVPVTKTTNAVLVMSHSAVHEPMHCIRCARCVQACPYNLMPASIAKASMMQRWGVADKLSALECMECGSCAYVCPSKIPLVQHIRVAKAELIRQKKEAA